MNRILPEMGDRVKVVTIIPSGKNNSGKNNPEYKFVGRTGTVTGYGDSRTDYRMIVVTFDSRPKCSFIFYTAELNILLFRNPDRLKPNGE